MARVNIVNASGLTGVAHIIHVVRIVDGRSGIMITILAIDVAVYFYSSFNSRIPLLFMAVIVTHSSK